MGLLSIGLIETKVGTGRIPGWFLEPRLVGVFKVLIYDPVSPLYGPLMADLTILWRIFVFV